MTIRNTLPNTLTVFMLVGLLAGCASSSYVTTNPWSGSPNGTTSGSSTGKQIASIALNQIGTPYRYGGSSPSGFDCSGLVQYSHAQVGINVPRTTSSQYNGAMRKNNPQVGDVLFFKIDGRVSHSGIYIGKGKFVHAPSSGKQVEVTRLDNVYFHDKLVGLKRFY
ncbi:MAG: C40 family peptidase [Gammaproteobacteria bacterium]|nr:C40 family peptidase [Gammaproteobacteria bacterium]